MRHSAAGTVHGIERYRAIILAGGGLLTAVLLQLGEALTPGRPLGGIELVNLLLSAAIMAGVYFPADAWVKLAAGVAGAIGQTLIAAITDNRVTAAEVVVVAVALLAALGIGALPNSPALDVADPPVPEPFFPTEGTVGGRVV